MLDIIAFNKALNIPWMLNKILGSIQRNLHLYCCKLTKSICLNDRQPVKVSNTLNDGQF